MIVDITYKNIRVFRDDTVFSMEAGEAHEKGGNVIRTEAGGEIVRTLKVGAVYGPNSSGKTTIVSVIYFLRGWILNISYDYFSDVIAPFALDENKLSLPSVIRLRFIAGGRLLSYKVGFLKGKCCEETLCEERDGNQEIIFLRSVRASGIHKVEFGDAIAQEAPELEVTPDKSILGLFNSLRLPIVSEAAKYIATLGITNSYNSNMMQVLFNEVRPWINKNGNRRRLVEFENCFDINLKDIKIPQKPESSNSDIKFVHTRTKDNGTEQKDIEFRAYLESSGTRVLTLLGAKVLQTLDEGGVLMVDEFDSGFHTEVTRTVIEMFRDPVINSKGAQLILTTHNVTLMDEKVFRKDQIWFIEKNAQGASELYSLAEFEDVTEDTRFSEWYLAKRFGAFPHPDMVKLRSLFAGEAL